MRTSVSAGLGVAIALVIAVLLARQRPAPVADPLGREGGPARAGDLHLRQALAGESDAPSVARSAARALLGRHARGVRDGDPAATSRSGPDGPTLAAILAGEAEPVLLSADELAQWRGRASTNVAEWLAARQLGGGAELLKEALKHFPNDPQVLIAASVFDDDPQARRERLDRLKAADPENALANYLSARDHLKAGRFEEALADLQAADGKPGYSDYTRNAMEAAQAMLLEAGRSPSEATVLGMSTAHLPHLTQLKNLALEMNELQKQYAAEGDPASAANLANYGLKMAERLGDHGGGSLLINQLVGQAVQQILLRNLPGEAQPEFLDGSVQAHLDTLSTRRAELRELGQRAETWIRTASAADLEAYFQRLYHEGELSAIAWTQTRPPPPPAP